MRDRGSILIPSLIIASSLVALRATGQVTCDPEYCVITTTPPPCKVANENFDDQGCPEDFATSDMDYCFSDEPPAGYPHVDTGDGQLMALDNDETRDCGVLRVKETGYYAIFDTELSESCLDQTDETGYLTVFNSCNGDGWATQRNVGERYLVQDSDNVGEGCESDAECGADRVCRQGNNHGRCCVPREPVYMGTFLLVAGEENVLCINHWCPEAMADSALSKVMVNDACETGPNSIHFRIAASAFLCKQEGYMQPCVGGCNAGTCLENPCLDHGCAAFCEVTSENTAACVDENPCLGKPCGWGCAYGLCLQPPDARGEDQDGDGFTHLADCNDRDAAVNPGTAEVGSNDKDDNCNGVIDEAAGTPGSAQLAGDGDYGAGHWGPLDPGSTGVGGTTPTSGGSGANNGSGSGSGADGDTGDSDGCGCRMAGAGTASGLGLLILALTTSVVRRRKRPSPRAAHLPRRGA